MPDRTSRCLKARAWLALAPAETKLTDLPLAIRSHFLASGMRPRPFCYSRLLAYVARYPFPELGRDPSPEDQLEMLNHMVDILAQVCPPSDI